MPPEAFQINSTHEGLISHLNLQFFSAWQSVPTSPYKGN